MTADQSPYLQRMDEADLPESENGSKPTFPSELSRSKVVFADQGRILGVDYLVPNRVPSLGVALLIGYGGTGKSTWATTLAGEVTVGGGPLLRGGVLDEPGYVLWITREENWESTLRPRLRYGAGADMSKVAYFQMSGDGYDDRDETPEIRLPSMRGLLVERIEEMGEIPWRLIVFDALGSFPDEGLNINSNPDARRVLEAMDRICHHFGAAGICIHHFGKGEGGSAFEKQSGSGGIVDHVRSALSFGSLRGGSSPEADDPIRALMQTKSNDGLPATPQEYMIEPVAYRDDEGVDRTTSRLVLLGENPEIRFEWLAKGMESAISRHRPADRLTALIDRHFKTVRAVNAHVANEALLALFAATWPDDDLPSGSTLERAITARYPEKVRVGNQPGQRTFRVMDGDVTWLRSTLATLEADGDRKVAAIGSGSGDATDLLLDDPIIAAAVGEEKGVDHG